MVFQLFLIKGAYASNQWINSRWRGKQEGWFCLDHKLTHTKNDEWLNCLDVDDDKDGDDNDHAIFWLGIGSTDKKYCIHCYWSSSHTTGCSLYNSRHF